MAVYETPEMGVHPYFCDRFFWAMEAQLWPYILRLVIDVFTEYEGNRLAAWSALTGPIIGALVLTIATEVGFRGVGFLQAKALPRLEADIRMTMFDYIQRHSPRYFNERFAGSLANKITDMITQVGSIIQALLWPIIPALSSCILGTIFLWFVNPLFAWIMMGWIVVHLSVCIIFSRACDAYEHKHGESRSILSGKIVDSLTNNFVVNLFYRFKEERKYVDVFQKDEEGTNRKAKTYVEKLRCALSVIYFVGIILGTNGSMIYLWVHSQISTGEVVQVFQTGWSITLLLWSLGATLPSLFQSFGIAKQAYSVMKDPEDIKDEPGAKPLVVSSGEIVFDNVSFRYGEKQLFQNKHVRIRGGEKVGLVGYTGAGKSTFINLILRLFPLNSGKITIDGQEVAQVTLESVRRQIALIPQDPILFHRELFENIRYGNPVASQEEVEQAAKLAYCDDFIRNIPGGYGAKVGERGTKLSGGEKQRIAIARAILASAPILILDEATSALDSVTERYIQSSLEKLMENRTTLVIAHRLSTLSRMDRILVFDQGKIVEEGKHTDLLEKGGLYSRMWKMQVGGFLPEVAT
ncbi:MAG: ABC transporter ATP-binding protein/permease [Rhabdochlamydiaceae bacterium]|jgi:ATP-binding cassette subfamily B protein